MKTLKLQSILLETNIFLALPILFILGFFGDETFGVSIYDVTILPGSSNTSVNGFEPATLSNPVGAIVKWTNEDFTLHTVTSGSASGGEVTQSAMNEAKDILSTASNATANATGELMIRANNVLSLTSDAASNATETAMNKTMNILGKTTSNESSSPTIASPTITVPTIANYSSNLYHIQFQYPTSWELNEKTSRFDEGTDISVSGSSPSGIITIQYLNASVIQNLDFLSAVYEFFKSSIGSDYSKEYKVIEQPSFVTIDNKKAGTYLFTNKDKYEEFATKWASQIWVVYVGNHGYLLSFMASTNVFDSPEVKNIRDQFIKSIKFTRLTNEPQNNVPNRFN